MRAWAESAHPAVNAERSESLDVFMMLWGFGVWRLDTGWYEIRVTVTTKFYQRMYVYIKSQTICRMDLFSYETLMRFAIIGDIPRYRREASRATFLRRACNRLNFRLPDLAGICFGTIHDPGRGRIW